MNRPRTTPVLLAVLVVAAVAACADGPAGPGDVEFEVIEEVQFAPSLGIDLSQMTRLNSGVYYQDLVHGTGDTLTYGALVTLDYRAWLRTGAQFDQATDFSYITGNFEVIQGFEQGMLGMLVGGTRKVIVPPALGYGATAVPGVPAGSILIFEIKLKQILGT